MLLQKLLSALALAAIFSSKIWADPIRSAEPTLPASFHFCPPSGGVDSTRESIKPASCKDWDDGSFRVTQVFGGATPYYFSTDQLNWSTNPSFEQLRAGTYTLFIRDSVGFVFTKEVVVPEPPELRVELQASKSKVKRGEIFQITAIPGQSSPEIQTLSWRPPDLFTDHQKFTQEISLQNTTLLAVEIITPLGCLARAHTTVEVEKSKVFVPNTFMPGSSNNNFFTVYADEGVTKVISLRVFDRWGKLIFESLDFTPNDPFQGWDGKIKGKRHTGGVFQWIVEVEHLDKSTEKIAGTVTLIRGVE